MADKNEASGRQIKQMVNFIMQEAHEKVNEIKIKVIFIYRGVYYFYVYIILDLYGDYNYFANSLIYFSMIIIIIIVCQTEHDFNLEKQNLVHNGKLRVQEEYAQKEKDLEIQQRM